MKTKTGDIQSRTSRPASSHRSAQTVAAAIPSGVVIDEYVDLSHAFFSGAEPSLVNAVLDRLARRIRRDELGTGRGG